MPDQLARRKHPRFELSPPATLSFRCSGGRVRVPVVDMSASGCQVLLPPALCTPETTFGILEELEIHHPAIPVLDLRGVLVHQQGRGKTGIEFLGVPKDLYFLLQGLARSQREH